MADPQPERKDENVSATTPDQPNPTNVPGVPPGPPRLTARQAVVNRARLNFPRNSNGASTPVSHALERTT
ncbi:hypothetical protein B7760_05814 (plasmid) [Burkholderia glumae]|nr:hypothetical protein B7760_05814 [Burkholderia glumae]